MLTPSVEPVWFPDGCEDEGRRGAQDGSEALAEATGRKYPSIELGRLGGMMRASSPYSVHQGTHTWLPRQTLRAAPDSLDLLACTSGARPLVCTFSFLSFQT